MAQPFVNEIAEQQRVDGVFLATRKTLLTTRTGAPYLSVTLSDRTGELEGRVWDEAERIDQSFERGAYVRVQGLASAYNGKLQLKVDELRPVPAESVDPGDFLPSTRYDVELMWNELRAMIDAIGDEYVRQLLQAFLDDPEIGPRLRRAPAAKNVHHPFVGGLLEHTLSVMQLAHRIADHYPRADRDLLVAGAFLHDLGKTREFDLEGGIDYSTEGRLVGHLIFTSQWIHQKASRIEGFPRELEMHLVHLVAAHHGELEKGSPKVPQTLEAMIVHALDELDSRVQAWTMIMDRDRNEEWTDFQRLYDRFLLKGPGWGRERHGYGPAPQSERWTGESLYRRESEGDLDGSAKEAPPPRRGRAKTETSGEKEPARRRKEPEPEQPPMPDLFSVRRSG